jgi:transcriptional regulator with XRE-family HTH domain
MIEKRLKELNKSMYELAKDIGESDQRTQYIVKKKNFAKDYILLKRIANALDCDIEDLLDDDEKQELNKLK